ncbi:hypothetical protein RJ640_017630 [Escallonia rubra]|uniref:DUF7032 domain-containing protein n=1 Tax=Escallonia rubra TaxID=112253 RepID=A0AA88R8D6_9ASTE|nr:hypothetical protein RJ640_017630 [Escallonia rubra]
MPELNLQKPESPGEPSLRQAIELISTLISVSHSIRVFAVKWQLIRNKLDELLSGLTAINNSDSGENPSLSAEVIHSITTTLRETHDLARRCLDLSFSGKLLMQSNLDILAAKFDNHVKNLSEIYTAGLMSHDYAIVLSRPCAAASRDDMKFYVKDILSRFKVGATDMKKQALVSLNELIQEEEKYVKIAVEIHSLVALLVDFLDSQDIEIQEQAAKAVSIISGFDSYKGVLVGAGIIAPLIRVLESGNELGIECATRCLQNVTQNSNNAWSISAHGGVTALLKMCANCDCSGEMVGLACGVLKNIVGVDEIKRFMVEEGAISLFIKLARSRDEVTQISSFEFLQIISYGDESIRQQVVREGGIRMLVRVMDPKSSFSSKGREMALKVIMNLCLKPSSSLSILMSSGFMDHVLYYLRYGEGSVQEMALKAACWLGDTSEEAKRAMGDAGFMPELIKFLDAKSSEVREMAARALSSMVVVPRNRKRFVQNDQNIGLLLQSIDPEEANSSSRKHLLSVLMSLTSCSSGKKKIVNSGYLKNIEKLAEAEVTDAKKIVRKLTANRFKGKMIDTILTSAT